VRIQRWVDLTLLRHNPSGLINNRMIAWVIYRAADADGVRRGHDLVAGNLRRSAESTEPQAARVIALVRVNLGIQYRHAGR
jgi:hypothetical protein